LVAWDKLVLDAGKWVMLFLLRKVAERAVLMEVLCYVLR
jgi:hypothetical protein